MGSVIFGLGLILIIAYNWEKMGRYVKLLLIFASMLAAHAAGYHFTREDSSRKGLGEGVSLLGTMLFEPYFQYNRIGGSGRSEFGLLLKYAFRIH